MEVNIYQTMHMKSTAHKQKTYVVDANGTDITKADSCVATRILNIVDVIRNTQIHAIDGKRG